jgi:hypothetical protein
MAPVTQSATSNRPSRLRSEAWLLRGISSIPGELALKGETLSFTALNTGSAWPWQLRKLEREMAAPGIAETIDRGERTLVFSWPVREIEAWCPWFYFGGGIKLKRQGLGLRFSFGAPANTQSVQRRMDPIAAAENIGGTLGQVQAMRSLGAMWQAALRPPSSEPRGTAGAP